MAGVLLERADIALWSDVETTRIVIDRLRVLVPTKRYEMALVRFEGDSAPTAFRGEGQSRSYQMTAMFLRDEHAEMAALVALFDAAYESPDGLLMLRTHMGSVPDLNPVEAVVVSEVSTAWAASGVGEVSFTAEAVQHTLSA
jgi:hypothetical protein